MAEFLSQRAQGADPDLYAATRAVMIPALITAMADGELAEAEICAVLCEFQVAMAVFELTAVAQDRDTLLAVGREILADLRIHGDQSVFAWSESRLPRKAHRFAAIHLALHVAAVDGTLQSGAMAVLSPMAKRLGIEGQALDLMTDIAVKGLRPKGIPVPTFH